MSSLPPHLFIIFGASGDLTRRKLVPALYHAMQRHDELRCGFVLGAARSGWNDGHFRQVVRDELREHGFSEEQLSAWCDAHLFYQSLGESGDDYEGLAERIRAIEQEHGLPGHRVFYLALPPGVFEPTIVGLGDEGLHRSDGWTRLVVEKPFGRDLATAQQLNTLVHRYFGERQIYRIDHYLGKETVQNLLAFRFANVLFESVWHRDRIARVEITVDEDLGVGTRAGYYDRSGALRDMVQNHLTQLLCLVAMEAPARFEADAIRREKIKLLESIAQLDPQQAVLGQYAAGTADGEAVPGYRDEDGVDDDSTTPTFVEVCLQVDNWRWQGVPFVLRTGKRMPERRTEISIHFKRAPIALFRTFDDQCQLHSNVLTITLQPDEGFDLHFDVKEPRSTMRLATQRLHFRYDEAFGPLPDAYETLLLDVIRGDQTLFVHADEVEASWRLYAPLLDDGLPLRPYPAGSFGPAASRRTTRPQPIAAS